MEKVKNLLLAFLSFTTITSAQEIALTFDDAPTADGAYYTGIERTQTLIEKLKDMNVPQVAFFCVSSRVDSAGMARLRKYTEAGHLIANHSHTHSRIHQISAANYIQDIFKADSIERLENHLPD
jgi:peptidoglycan/xylan/chitin deacetylase (PgdA/CDA1 family)